MSSRNNYRNTTRLARSQRFNIIFVLVLCGLLVAVGGYLLVFRSRAAACPVNANLTPGCSGVLWGFYESGGADTRPMESRVGRAFDVFRRYRSIVQVPASGSSWSWPTALDTTLAQGGRIMHLSLESKVYGGSAPGSIDGVAVPQPNWTVSGNNAGTYYGYDQLSSGQLDPLLRKLAQHIKGLPYRVMLDWGAEGVDTTNGNFGAPGTAARDQLSAGWKAAYIHIHDVFKAQGASNVVWSYTVGGWDTDGAYTKTYPGDAYVDWVMWDPYNHNPSAWKDAYTTFAGFYQRVEGGLLGGGAKAKPYGLAEYGSSADARRAAWLKGIPGALRLLPKIRSVEYFNSGSWAYFSDNTTDVAAFAEAGHDGYVNAYLTAQVAAPPPSSVPARTPTPTPVAVTPILAPSSGSNAGARPSSAGTASTVGAGIAPGGSGNGEGQGGDGAFVITPTAVGANVQADATHPVRVVSGARPVVKGELKLSILGATGNVTVKVDGVVVSHGGRLDTTYLTNGQHTVTLEATVDGAKKIVTRDVMVENKLAPWQAVRNQLFLPFHGNKNAVDLGVVIVLGILAGLGALGVWWFWHRVRNPQASTLRF